MIRAEVHARIRLLIRPLVRHVYTALWALALGPAWCWWAWKNRASVGPGERGRWRERMAWGDYPEAARHGLLVHAASLGEGVAAVALLREFRAIAPGMNLLVTCTSFTGARFLRQALADPVFDGPVPQVFLPFDLPGAMGRLVDKLQPRAIVLMETELWPNLLAAARFRGIPVVLANARLSAGSARAYGRAAPLSQPMLQGLALVLAQSRHIARRFQALGVPAARLQVAGNVKSDLSIPMPARNQAAVWREQLGERLVLVAGSTHAGEDKALLAAWPLVLAQHPQALLVLVPRHPQRFDAVAALIAQHGHALLRRSQGDSPTPEQSLWLGDTLGEMLAWFGLADLAFIGGSLVAHGGHSPLEAMAWGCPVLSGPFVHNFAQAYQQLARAGGLCRLDSSAPEAIAAAIGPLLADAPQRLRLGQAGQDVFDLSAGAAERCALALADLLARPPGSVLRTDDGQTAVWLDTAYRPALPEAPLDADTWRHQGAWTDTVGGRGSAGFIRHGGPGNPGLVLRHYRRGGLVARLLHDRYLGRNPFTSRAMREFSLLAQLRDAGLPVPQPVAARCQRVNAFSYRADLLLVRIADAPSLAEHLGRGQPLPLAHWQSVGQTIARLHQQFVDHVDLNAHNLLIDPQGQVWLIDFDRCRRRSTPPPAAWAQRNLDRLLRSLRKLQARQRDFAFSDADWQALTEAYRVFFTR